MSCSLWILTWQFRRSAAPFLSTYDIKQLSHRSVLYEHIFIRICLLFETEWSADPTNDAMTTATISGNRPSSTCLIRSGGFKFCQRFSFICHINIHQSSVPRSIRFPDCVLPLERSIWFCQGFEINLHMVLYPWQRSQWLRNVVCFQWLGGFEQSSITGHFWLCFTHNPSLSRITTPSPRAINSKKTWESVYVRSEAFFNWISNWQAISFPEWQFWESSDQ